MKKFDVANYSVDILLIGVLLERLLQKYIYSLLRNAETITAPHMIDHPVWAASVLK